VSCRRQSSERPRAGTLIPRGDKTLFLLSLLFAAQLLAQTTESDRPVPILTGTAGYFNFVTAGQNQLLPLGDRWLVESRAEFQGAFQRPPDGGSYGGMVSKNLDYAQVDYIANPFVTVTVGRFLTPFGIFNERLYPIWIRSLQQDPLILPLSAESNDGMMLRGGCPGQLQLCRIRFSHQHGAQQPAVESRCRGAHGRLFALSAD
jgi:hypothetical protein